MNEFPNPTNLTPVDKMIDITTVEGSLVDIKNSSYDYLYNTQRELIELNRFDLTASELEKFDDNTYTFSIHHQFITIGRRDRFKRSKWFNSRISLSDVENNPDTFHRTFFMFMDGEFIKNISIECDERITRIYYNITNPSDKTKIELAIQNNHPITFFTLPNIQIDEFSTTKTTLINSNYILTGYNKFISPLVKDLLIFASTTTDLNVERLVKSTYNPNNNNIQLGYQFPSTGERITFNILKSPHLAWIMNMNPNDGMVQNFFTHDTNMPLPIENILIFEKRANDTYKFVHKNIVELSYPNKYTVDMNKLELGNEDVYEIKISGFYMEDGTNELRYENLTEDLYQYYEKINTVPKLNNSPSDNFDMLDIIEANVGELMISRDLTNRLTRIDKFDRDKNEWEHLSTISNSDMGYEQFYQFFSAVEVDNKVYISTALGFNFSIGLVALSFLVYDILNDSWSVLNSNDYRVTLPNILTPGSTNYQSIITGNKYNGNILYSIQFFDSLSNTYKFNLLEFDIINNKISNVITTGDNKPIEGQYRHSLVINDELWFINSFTVVSTPGSLSNIMCRLNLVTKMWEAKIENQYIETDDMVSVLSENKEDIIFFPQKITPITYNRIIVKYNIPSNTWYKFTGYKLVFQDNFVPRKGINISGRLLFIDSMFNTRFFDSLNNEWIVLEDNVNIFLKNFKQDKFTYNIANYHEYEKLNPDRLGHVAYKLDVVSDTFNKYPVFLKYYYEKMTDIPSATIINLGDFDLSNLIRDRGRMDNTLEIGNEDNWDYFDTVHLVFRIENNVSSEPQNISLFFEGYLYPDFRVYTNNDGFDYLYINLDEREGFDPLTSNNPIVKFIIKEHTTDMLPVIQIEKHDGSFQNRIIDIVADSSKELPRIDNMIVNDISVEISTKYGKIQASPGVDYTITNTIYGNKYPVSTNPYSIVKNAIIESSENIKVRIKNDYYIHTEYITESSVEKEIIIPNDGQTMDSKFRVFLNNKYLSPSYYNIEIDIEVLVATIKVLMMEGDTITIEILPVDINEEISYFKSVDENTGLIDLYFPLSYPFSHLYNRVYVNGKRLTPYEIKIINPYTIAIQDLNDDIKIGSVKNVSVTGPRRLSEGSFILNKEASIITDIDEFVKDIKIEELDSIEDFLDDMISSDEDYEKILRRAFLGELHDILIIEDKYIIPPSIFDDYLPILEGNDTFVINGGESLNEDMYDAIILDPNN